MVKFFSLVFIFSIFTCLNSKSGICMVEPRQATFNANSAPDVINVFFNEYFSTLPQYKHHNYAESTAKAIFEVFNHRLEISKLGTEKERSGFILKKTGLLVEPGFSAGTDEKSRLENIMYKVSVLMQSFEFAKEHCQLGTYFYEAFRSDPCFNGRMIKLEEYLETNLFNLNQLESEVDIHGAHKFFIALETMATEQNLDQAPTILEFKQYLRQMPNYEIDFKEGVESHRFVSIYNYAKLGVFPPEFSDTQ